MNFFRGTTPNINIGIRVKGTSEYVDLNTVTTLVLSFQQNGKVLLNKTLDDMAIVDNKLVLSLTQEETLMFEEGKKVTVQGRYLIGGEYNAFATFKTEMGVNGIIREGVLTNE